MKKTLIALALVGATAANAALIFQTGNKLLEQITSDDVVLQMTAYGYIAGVHDTYSGIAICKPTTATLRQLADVVRLELEARPDQRHLAADSIIFNALSRVWPCADKKTKSSKNV